MEKLIDLYEILKNAPRGMELYVPEIGTLYLHTASIDNYGSLGDNVAIKLTKRKPRYERHQIGGYCQYRHEEIDYCFDRYGRMYLTDPHYRKDDRAFMKDGEQYLYNGRKFLTTNCMIFPDESLTWDNWQRKLFMPGDMIVIPIHEEAKYPWDKDSPPPVDVISTGYVKEISKNGGITIVDIVKETIEDRRHSHDYLDSPSYFYPDQIKESRFAGQQDWMEWSSNKRVIEQIKNGTYKPFRFPYDNF